MSRVRGSISIATNYEVALTKPMDARMLVSSYEDLLDKNNWTTTKGTPCCFNGMFVAVANLTDTSKNGLYMLVDTANTRKPDVSVETNWIKIGESSDISQFVARIETIEEELLNISSSIEDLDSRLKAVEDESDVITYGYRKDFPTEGESNKLYIAADESKTYIWFDESYIPVGGYADQPDIIYGGTAN